MKRNDILIGILVLAVIAGVIYFIRKPKAPKFADLPEITTIEEEFENTFNLDIPDNVDKAQLKDITDGDASGIATRVFENGLFDHTVLADLDDPQTGYYEGWLVFQDLYISTGPLRMAKGGYMLEYQSTTNYSDYAKVVVTHETVSDALPETHILEGEF